MIMSGAATSSSTTGRVAIVTGANKGIGYFIALELALSGLFQHIVLGCRDTSRAAQAVQSIQGELASLQSSSQPVQVSSAPLIVGNVDSHTSFVNHIRDSFGKVDVLVNNAGMAFKGADPTPFAQQTKPTLDVNYRGTADLTEQLIPLLKQGKDARIVSVASLAGRLNQVSPALQAKFQDPSLTIPELNQLIQDFEDAVQDGTHADKGWSSSNYGMSKLAVTAATKI